MTVLWIIVTFYIPPFTNLIVIVLWLTLAKINALFFTYSSLKINFLLTDGMSAILQRFLPNFHSTVISAQCQLDNNLIINLKQSLLSSRKQKVQTKALYVTSHLYCLHIHQWQMWLIPSKWRLSQVLSKWRKRIFRFLLFKLHFDTRIVLLSWALPDSWLDIFRLRLEWVMSYKWWFSTSGSKRALF